MNFKIILGDKGNVDFDSTIQMNNLEKEQFFSLMKTLFEPVEKEEVQNFRSWRIGGNRIQYPREWTAKEYEVLLKSRTLEEAINKLGRSGMAVIVQDGKWRPEFFFWCESKGKNPFEGDLLQMIRQFMKDKKDELLAKRQKKKFLRSNEKRISDLKFELLGLNSPQNIDKINLLIKLSPNKYPYKNFDEYLFAKKKDIEDEIRVLEEEINN